MLNFPSEYSLYFGYTGWGKIEASRKTEAFWAEKKNRGNQGWIIQKFWSIRRAFHVYISKLHWYLRYIVYLRRTHGIRVVTNETLLSSLQMFLICAWRQTKTKSSHLVPVCVISVIPNYTQIIEFSLMKLIRFSLMLMYFSFDVN